MNVINTFYRAMARGIGWRVSFTRLTLAMRVAAVIAMAVPAAAQITTGSVAGTIKDAQGGVVPGATVTLVSESRGSRSAPVVTNDAGDFVFVNVSVDTYTLDVEMASFRTLRQTGVAVSPGSRVTVGTLTLDVSGAEETVHVSGGIAAIQANSGERSFTVPRAAMDNLPIGNRSFTSMAALSPGVSGTTRIGGGGASNIMMDGVSTLDTGNNGVLLQMNVESIGELKILTSTYQAEYGRSSGLQITAVTKSGTNAFRGSLYDVERNSKWNANSRTNILNGDPKPVQKERDAGFSIGGPIGRPGGGNKLFFFYAQEWEPRTSGGDVVRYRVPTAAERAGDFSRTTDNLGNLYPYIKDPLSSGACSATSQAGCFADGGVLGKIPANRLYQPGLRVLDSYPLPNLTNVPAGQAYNFELTRPEESAQNTQIATRLDYEPWTGLRATFKYSGSIQRNQTFNGSLPGFNDTRMQRPIVSTWATSINYTLGPTTFLEATYGRSQNELAGCLIGQSTTGPTFCTSAIPMSPASNRNDAGFGDLPFLFPDAGLIDPNYYAYGALDSVRPPFWQNGNVLLPPRFAWGSRVANAPPTIGWPGVLNRNTTQDVAISLTRVAGRHTWKGGFYLNHSLKATSLNSDAFGTLNFTQDTVGTNPYDTSFGFANAAVGSFSSYVQASKYVETSSVYNNIEGYIQDTWRAGARLTLDYGLRLVHQQPQHDILGQASNFFPERWTAADAPALYTSGCANNVSPCTGTNRQALDPRTGRFLGPNSTLAVGTLVPGSGNLTNGLVRQGQGIAETNFIWPTLSLAPRLGMAYDLTGTQRIVLRGGAGLFFDRPGGGGGTPIVSSVNNPPTSQTVTVRYGQLQTLGTGGLTTQGAPALNGLFVYDSGGLPSSTQWNAGVQAALPWASTIDVAYVGQHSFNTVQVVNLNAIDFGTAFLPSTQDCTVTASSTPGATSFAATNPDLVRAFQGYGTISQQQQGGWRTYHGLQLSFNRRLANGVSLGFNDTISLYDHQSTAVRLQHNADGSFAVRPDQADADRLLGTTINQVHVLKGTFIWDLPDLRASGGVLRAIGAIANDWQFSGIWSGATGTPYDITASYQSGGANVNLTGSPDYAPRIRIAGDPGNGCSSDTYRQFNTSAFQGPAVGSVGLDSGTGYLRGCFASQLDLAIARNIAVGGSRRLQLRLDLFNALNQAGITGRVTALNLSSPTDPATAQNLPFDANGNLIAARSLPRGAGFGVANAYQTPLMVQAWVRLSF